MNVSDLGLWASFWRMIARELHPPLNTESFLGEKAPGADTYTYLVRPAGSSDIPVNVGERIRYGPGFQGYAVEPDH